MFPRLIFALALSGAPLLVPAAHASPTIEIVPKSSGHQGRSATLSTGSATIAGSDFVNVILDSSKYPRDATYMGVPALLDCKVLERRSDGYTIMYQRTGGNSLIKSRHWVIALRVVKQTATDATIEWFSVNHTFNGSAYEGPYASALNAHLDAVYAPYVHGMWKLDGTAHTVTYSAESDPGGSVPSWLMSEGAVLAFPKALLKQRWGIDG